MNHLPEDYNQEIREHLAVAEKLVGAIESGRSPNGRVMDNDFLGPTIRTGSFPFNDQRGELVYYRAIRDALQRALDTGVVPQRYFEYLIRAPPRIRGLLEHDNPDRIA